MMKMQDKQFACDTSKWSAGDWAKALVVLFVGLMIAHLGITLFLLSDLGTDTFTVFVQGIAYRTGWSVGMMQMTVVCILLVLLFLTTKGYVKLGTIVCALFGGPIIDFFTWVLGTYINGDATMAVRISFIG